MSEPVSDPQTVYEAVGGDPFFETLAERFYEGVATDPELLALYPTPDDLSDATRHLAQFLIQYWGGPTTYSDQRGHPRLRMRHHPFVIGQAARDGWVRHMSAALDRAEGLDPEIEARMREYFDMAATHLINAPGQ
ncbi:MAG: globin [Actinomycetota bacterium]